MISTASSVYTPRLDAVGRWLSPLALRTLLAWEFFESGREKLGGQNWFADLEGRFPFPFSALPASLNWQLATWLGLVGAVMLLLGLATRSVAYVFWVLTIVAIAAVHWPDQWNGLGELWQGYAITDQGYGNFKLPLLFLAMLLPLILNGGGALSVDRLLAGSQHAAVSNDGLGWGVSLIALLLPVAALLPGIGLGGALLGGVLLLGYLLRRRHAAGAESPVPAPFAFRRLLGGVHPARPACFPKESSPCPSRPRTPPPPACRASVPSALPWPVACCWPARPPRSNRWRSARWP